MKFSILSKKEKKIDNPMTAEQMIESMKQLDFYLEQQAIKSMTILMERL